MAKLPPRKTIEIPPEAARSFVKDMRAYHATKDSDKRTAIAARQAEQLSRHAGARVNRCGSVRRPSRFRLILVGPRGAK
jgi:hypothetical protein